jgi:hypothetical protein
MIRSLLIATLLGLCAAPSFASDESALAKAGILGAWAMDCSKPSSGSNYYLVYAINKDGAATETQRTTSDSVRQIRNVQTISDTWLLYSYLDADGEMLSILTFRDGGRKKSWWSVGKDGKAYIMGGNFADGGKSVPWFEKCK